MPEGLNVTKEPISQIDRVETCEKMNINLNLLSKPQYEKSIKSYQYHSYQPLNINTYGANDEIQIQIQQQDLLTHIHESYIYLEGKITKSWIRRERVYFDKKCFSFPI